MKRLILFSIIACLTGCGLPLYQPEVDIDKPQDQDEIDMSKAVELDNYRRLQIAEEYYEVAVYLYGNGLKEKAREMVDKALHLILLCDDEMEKNLDLKRDTLLTNSYQLISKMYRSPESLAEEKSDTLNLKIGSKNTSSQFPLILNDRVQREIDFYLYTQRGLFISTYKRMGKYLHIIKPIIKQEGIPEEIIYLPFVESAFKPRAQSRVGALGMWQFMKATGKKYGLKRTQWYDNRMDVEKSTEAAAKHLNYLYDLYGDWLLALAAYNSGEGRVLSRINIQQTKDYWELDLPMETKHYVPRLMAVIHILNDPEKYDLELGEMDPSVEYDTFVVNKSVSLENIAKISRVDKTYIKTLNPELRTSYTPPFKYQLNIPFNTGEILAERLDDIPVYNYKRSTKKKWGKHRVRKGESLSNIARKYGTSLSVIVQSNGIQNPNKISAGTVLKVPTKNSKETAPPVTYGKGVQKVHVVRRGETLWDIAKHYRLSMNDLLVWNGISCNNRIYPKDEIRLYGKKNKGKKPSVHIVSQGENLSTIAQKHSISANALMRYNRFRKSESIYPGQKIYMYNRELIANYTVQSGDTLFDIGQKHNMSVNRIMELNNLSKATIFPGQNIKVIASK